MSVLSEHIDQMWGVNSVGGLWYRTGMTSAVPAGKISFENIVGTIQPKFAPMLFETENTY